MGESHGLQTFPQSLTLPNQNPNMDCCFLCLTTMYMPKNLGLPETLMCKIITPNQTLLVRALIDPGSQITAIATATVTELGLRGPKRNLKIGTSGAQKIIFKDMSVVHFKLASLDEKYVTNYNIEAITMPKPTCDIGQININPKSNSNNNTMIVVVAS